jgi:hypothetical protein
MIGTPGAHQGINGRTITRNGSSGAVQTRLGRLGKEGDFRGGLEKASIELGTLNIFQLDGDRVFAWLFIVHIADSVGCEVSCAVLVVRDLELALVKTNAILDEE